MREWVVLWLLHTEICHVESSPRQPTGHHTHLYHSTVVTLSSDHFRVIYGWASDADSLGSERKQQIVVGLGLHTLKYIRTDKETRRNVATARNTVHKHRYARAQTRAL